MKASKPLSDETSLLAYAASPRPMSASVHFQKAVRYLKSKGDINLRDCVRRFEAIGISLQFTLLCALAEIKVTGAEDLLIKIIRGSSSLSGTAAAAVGRYASDKLLDEVVNIATNSRSLMARSAAIDAIGHLSSIKTKDVAINTCCNIAFVDTGCDKWYKALAISSLAQHLATLDKRTWLFKESVGKIIDTLDTEDDPLVLSAASKSLGMLRVMSVLPRLQWLSRNDRRATGNCSTVSTDAKEAITLLRVAAKTGGARKARDIARNQT